MFVTIEGIDGAGKSTLLESLEHEFDIITQEPDPTSNIDVRSRIESGTETPDEVIFHLFMADHMDHVRNKLMPHIEDDILCDRYVHSRLAYQSVKLNKSWRNILGVQNLHAWPRPDLTILLDLPADVALERIEGDETFEKQRFLEDVRGQYLLLADEFEYIETVDATLPPADLRDKCSTLLDRQRSSGTGHR